MKWYQKSIWIVVLLIAFLSIGGMTSCKASPSSASSITSTTIKAAVTTSTTSAAETTIQTTAVKETPAVTSVETKSTETKPKVTSTTTAKVTTASTTQKETAVATTEPAATTQALVLDTGTGEVYKTATGSKYHSDGCSYLSKSRIPIS